MTIVVFVVIAQAGNGLMGAQAQQLLQVKSSLLLPHADPSQAIPEAATENTRTQRLPAGEEGVRLGVGVGVELESEKEAGVGMEEEWECPGWVSLAVRSAALGLVE